MDTIIEEYEKVLVGKRVTITVKKTANSEFPYFAVSSLKVSSAGMTLDEAKTKCENATKMEILFQK
ncbi:hypothetical protein ACH6EH_08155 [Paenibacillus sp. JSM ZJ436]|uniref:hypothetical protein n=1 Tax=Paenibacillus sp. JSM ZJ436 TaxID=3376190 RepID=UPI0037AFDA7D